MDTESLVNSRIEDGQRLIAELKHAGFDTEVAFWVKSSEEGLWFLYLGTNTLSVKTLPDAYRAVYSCLQKIPSTLISISEVKIIQTGNPVAADAIAIRDRYPAKTPTRYAGDRLGNLSIDEAYIYPKSSAFSHQDVTQMIVSMMAGPESTPSYEFVLANGSIIRAVPIGFESRSGKMQIKFLTDAGEEQVIPIDEIVEYKAL
jgi:hypothetical protein